MGQLRKRGNECRQAGQEREAMEKGDVVSPLAPQAEGCEEERRAILLECSADPTASYQALRFGRGACRPNQSSSCLAVNSTSTSMSVLFFLCRSGPSGGHHVERQPRCPPGHGHGRLQPLGRDPQCAVDRLRSTGCSLRADQRARRRPMCRRRLGDRSRGRSRRGHTVR
jgi:hypothetical protein